MANKLFFRYGCMGSSKSAELLIVAYNYEQKGMNPIVLKPATDTRDYGEIKSRIGINRPCILFGESDDLRVLVNQYIKERKVDCVLVDESQFMSVEQVRQLYEVAVLDDIPVICYGLKIDYKGHGFDASKELLILAHEINEIKTICKCGKKATHHLLKVDGEYQFGGSGIFIGDTEFESVCGECFLTTKYEHKKKHTS